jgi:hypothetical protein
MTDKKYQKKRDVRPVVKKKKLRRFLLKFLKENNKFTYPEIIGKRRCKLQQKEKQEGEARSKDEK